MVGSSSSSSGVSWAIAIAIQARWRWPPESWSTGAVAQLLHAGQGQRVIDRVVIGLGRRLHERLVRIATPANEIGDRDPGHHDRLLREQPEPLGDFPRRVMVDHLAIEQDRAARRSQQPGERFEQASICRSRSGR